MSYKTPLISGFIFLIPAFVLAQDGIVPCTGTECQACHLVELAQNIIEFLIIVAVFIAVLMFVWAGFIMVTAAGDEGKIKSAKGMFVNVLIGILITLAAWLIIDTIMKILFSEESFGLGPWNEIQCTDIGETGVLTRPGDGYEDDDGGGAVVDDPQCSDDAALMAQYGGSPVGAEDPALREMINCYLRDSAVGAVVDRSQIYTTDRSYPRCALTNGNTACGPCSHSNNSCHYGRGSGNGAQAVDFNANTTVSEEELRDRLERAQSSCGGAILFEGSHTHISLSSCGS